MLQHMYKCNAICPTPGNILALHYVYIEIESNMF